MKGLFPRIFISFLAAQALILGALFAALLIGYDRSRVLWEEDNSRRTTAFAREVLVNGAANAGEAPTAEPLFVFDASRKLVYSNRGLGRMRQADGPALVPVRDHGRLLGYVNAPPRRFTDDPANTIFLGGMQTAVAIGLCASLLGALFFSFFFSRSIARPARRLAERLDRMAEGDLVSPVAGGGPAEIASLARSAERLGRELAGEKTMRARFSSDMAHDLRTPLAALRAQLEGMRDGVLDRTPDRLTRALRDLERLERLTDSLAELMRLEEPGYKISARPVDLDGLFHELGETFEAATRERRLRLQAEAGGLEVTADRDLLQRALGNLLSNAVRHTGEGGAVRLSARRAGRGTVITVWNPGPPVPPDELSHVFDRLFRGEFARSTPGSGLGLTIARQIAELHGGTIAMESAKETGTTVSITLPG